MRTSTLHLFWVNAPLCQGRAAALCSRQISHQNELFDSFYCIFVIHFFGTFFKLLTYTPRVKDTESLLLTYNLLTTELQKVLYLHLLFCKKQTHTSLGVRDWRGSKWRF